MYFSRIDLNPSRLSTKKLLSSPQLTKQLVLSSCGPEAGGGGANRVLWRLDKDGHRIQLYVVSPDRPDFTGVIEQAGWPTTRGWDCTEYEPFLSRLTEGQRWRFRLTANPTRSAAGVRGERGRVSPCRSRAQQEQWLLEKSPQLGITIPQQSLAGVMASDVAISERAQLAFSKQTEAGRKLRVAITQVTYDGIIEVADASHLRAALTAGVGRARGYGCGLLTLAPPHA